MSGDCDGSGLCAKCEELVQPYLDRELTEEERRQADTHLVACGYCAKRYRFEETLRMYVRRCCEEPLPQELKERLLLLRTDV